MSTEALRSWSEAFLAKEVRPRFSRALAAEKARGEVYLANHSLGRMPDAAASLVAEGLDAWLDPESAWDAWATASERFRSLTARLLGRADAHAVVPKTSAGQGLRAVLNSFGDEGPVRVVTTTEEFDSIDFVLRRYRDMGRAIVDWVEPTAAEGALPLLETQPICERISQGTDLVVLSHVYFQTGQILPGLEEIVTQAHERGALILLDMYHSYGVLPVSFDDTKVDFAIGGSYKYLRGGPGACWLALGKEVLASRRTTLDTGWFAREDVMGFTRGDEQRAATGGDSWLESTPPVLTPFLALPGLELVLELGVPAIRSHSLGILDRWRAALEGRGVPIHRPKEPSAWGAFAVVTTDERLHAPALRALGVITDSRGGFLRFCPDILTSEDDLETAASRVGTLRA
ncbi:MAG: aminotransferase class V-fold PLP-dependent enzyme [Fimbriimonadaceae bacterium]|nr:aminotransferase class V-fold PLP-dependent enzyme [Fimbriimonadaceae bacterium]